MAEELQPKESEGWKKTIGKFLTKKGLLIGSALVILGGVLEGTTDVGQAVMNIFQIFFK